MTAIIMREKTHELKEMIEQGLHIFGKCMNIAEQMCEGEIGERGGYGNRYGERGDYGMRDYPDDPYEYGERRGVRGTGRYSRY